MAVKCPVRIQASLLIWLKVVKQARESLGFFVKLRDILRPLTFNHYVYSRWSVLVPPLMVALQLQV